jgi:hypothetical protein
MDQDRQRRIEEASERFAEALADSYRTIYGQAAETQERQADLTREFYERVMVNLDEQSQRNRAASEELAGQARAQREAAGTIARESANAYLEFMNDAFARYQSNAEAAVGSAQNATSAVSQTTAGVVGTALGATRAATEGAVGGPIPGYDEMNVEEVSKSLDGLSDDQLRTVRDYEERHKNRETVLEQLDRKIRGS